MPNHASLTLFISLHEQTSILLSLSWSENTCSYYASSSTWENNLRWYPSLKSEVCCVQKESRAKKDGRTHSANFSPNIDKNSKLVRKKELSHNQNFCLRHQITFSSAGLWRWKTVFGWMPNQGCLKHKNSAISAAPRIITWLSHWWGWLLFLREI